jgi:uncharacterized phage infection (PIP) family protein YhgE
VLKLQDILQGNIRELVSMMNASGQGQLEFQAKTTAGLQALDDSISAIKQSQDQLQSRIDDVKSSTETISNEIPAIIEQLKDELSRIGMEETEELMDDDSFVSSDSEEIE